MSVDAHFFYYNFEDYFVSSIIWVSQVKINEKARVKKREMFGNLADFQYIKVAKQKRTPSMNKDRQIIS